MLRRAVLKRLSARRKAQLLRLRDEIRYTSRILTRARGVNKLVRSDIPIIFVIGGNRSGTSLCTYVISRHPAVEVITEEKQGSFSIHADGHSSGYGEASHLWRSLMDPSLDRMRGEGYLWGLPSFISEIYVNSASDTKRKRLIDEVLSSRTTNRIPLVKLNQNVFRIPLLKELFPQAKFVLITRDHKSYIRSCKHKWTEDIELGYASSDIHIDFPQIGFHWLMINSIALYDLKKHAEGDHVHIKLEELQGDKSIRVATINKVFRFLNLQPVEVNDETMFDGTYTYIRSEHAIDIDTMSSLLEDLISCENSLVHTARKKLATPIENVPDVAGENVPPDAE